MQLSDLTVEVRDKDLNRVGLIRPEELNLKLTDRLNNVGSWSLGLAAEHPLAGVLGQPGSGIVVLGKGKVLASGPTTRPYYEASSDDPEGTVRYEGVTDSVVLSDYLAWPQPSNSNPSTQSVSHDVRTGKAETLLHGYVNANLGPSAPSARRKAGLTMGTDGQRGPTLTKRARFDPLGTLLSEIAAVADLGFRVVQQGEGLVFETYAVTDRTDTIRLDVQNGTLSKHSLSLSPPGATRVIVAGQGEKEERTFIARDNALSVSAEAEWGRRIERFVDQRQTDEVAELQQAGDELLADEGFTAVSVQVVPMSDTTMIFGEDWGMGDRVTVVAGGVESTSIVTGFTLVADSGGFRMGAVLGEGERTSVSRGGGVVGRVSNLERNAESGGSHTHDYAATSHTHATPETVIPAPYVNGWSSYDYGGTATVTLRDGVVYLQGLVTPNGASSHGLTLPPGMRPRQHNIFLTQSSTGTKEMRVHTGGDLHIYGGQNGGWASISCSFPAA